MLGVQHTSRQLKTAKGTSCRFCAKNSVTSLRKNFRVLNPDVSGAYLQKLCPTHCQDGTSLWLFYLLVAGRRSGDWPCTYAKNGTTHHIGSSHCQAYVVYESAACCAYEWKDLSQQWYWTAEYRKGPNKLAGSLGSQEKRCLEVTMHPIDLLKHKR